MRLSSRRVIPLALVLACTVSDPAFAGRRSPEQTPLINTDYARTETYRYPAMELFLVVNKYGSEMTLSLQSARKTNAAALPAFKDFKLQVFDDRHEEVPCKPRTDQGDSPSYDQWSVVFYAMSLKPGHIPATASVWYQGYEHVFTFKLKANDPIK